MSFSLLTDAVAIVFFYNKEFNFHGWRNNFVSSELDNLNFIMLLI